MALYDKGEFQVSFKTAPDASLAETEGRMAVLLAALKDIPEIDHTYATIGAGDSGTVRDGLLYVKLKERSERKNDQFELQREVRERFGKIAGITFSIEEVGQIGGAMKPLNVDLKGDDLATLKQLGAASERGTLQGAGHRRSRDDPGARYPRIPDAGGSGKGPLRRGNHQRYRRLTGPTGGRRGDLHLRG